MANIPGVPDGMGGAYGGLITQGNARRGTEVLHRTGITATDTLALPTTPTASDVVETSASLAASGMHFGVAAGNRWGATTPTLDGGVVTPTLNHGLLVVVAQVVGADGYHIFVSTAAAPLYVGYITEAQRATGDRAIVTMGTVTARSSATVPGTVVVGIVGTGVATSAAPFTTNYAMTPTLVTPYPCDGMNAVYVGVKMTVTDLRSLPTLTLAYYRQSESSPNDWLRFNATAFAPLANNASIPLESESSLTVNGAKAIVALVQVISGQGTSVNVYFSPVT